MDNDFQAHQIAFLYPSQIWMAEKVGWVRGRDYRVYACLACLSDMDVCRCKLKSGKKPAQANEG